MFNLNTELFDVTLTFGALYAYKLQTLINPLLYGYRYVQENV